MNLAWYLHRLGRMRPGEIAWRVRDAALRHIWRYRRFRPNAPKETDRRLFVGGQGPVDTSTLPSGAVDSLVAAARRLLEGHWLIFGVDHPALAKQPNWFVDPRTGQCVPAYYSFDIRYRDESKIGNSKYIWEPSRHHHLTLLAAAYAVTGDESYARRVEAHLRSWWSENPFLVGPHWISGIELGIRLIAWVWIRRLLDGWRESAALFEHNPQFLEQLYYHQVWLATFPSRGSSANNHLIAEAAGQFVSACAFPCFNESARWRDQSAEVLRREIIAQTFSSGLNRELATDYHGFVLELFLCAAVEGELTENPLGELVWERIRAMTDALAAIMDSRGHPPRQGDSDQGMGLLMDAPDYDRWSALLGTGERLFGAQPWWPEPTDKDLRTCLWTRGVQRPALTRSRPSVRPDLLADAGLVFLRAGTGRDEIWCRCDHGPHGYLSIAAHGHADALSIELRIGEIQILADPGTYCYHGDRESRDYFRSTLGHNTLELLSQDQSVSGGPFMWTQHAQSRLISLEGLDSGEAAAIWQAEHTGYVERGGPIHRRTVVLERQLRSLTVRDEILDYGTSAVPARLAFHLGPEVKCHLQLAHAVLSWPNGRCEFNLASTLTWTLHRGEENPQLGWYSPSFGARVPSYVLLGTGTVSEETALVSTLKFGN